MSLRLYAPLALVFCGCHFLPSADGHRPLWAPKSNVFCLKPGRYFSLESQEPAQLQDGAPEVRLVKDGKTVNAATAIDGNDVRVSLADDVDDGLYDVVIKPPRGQAATLPGAVRVVRAPRIDGIASGGFCTDATREHPSLIHFKGAHFSEGMTVSAPQFELSATADATGEVVEVRAAGPDDLKIDPTKVYALDFDNGDGCVTRVESAMRFFDPPKIDISVGPILGGPDAFDPSSTITVRVQSAAGGDTSVSPEITAVTLAGKPASKITTTAQSAAGKSVDATFDPNTVAAGDRQPLYVAVNGCAPDHDEHFIKVAKGELPITLLNPTAVTESRDGRRYLDVYGDFSAAETEPSFYVDVNPDPIQQDQRRLLSDGPLDGKKKAYRLEIPSTKELGPSAGGPYDVLVRSGNKGGLAQAALRVYDTAKPTEPRIVAKDRDWIRAGQAQKITVYGCFFAEDLFSIVDEASGEVVKTTSAVVSAGGGFYCAPGGNYGPTQTAVLSDINLPAGNYRLRVTHLAGADTVSHRDSYPLAVLADGAAPGSFAALTMTLQVARKYPRVVSATDVTGVKYLYVIGGSATNGAPSLDPAVAESAEASYEFSQLGFDNEPMGFEPFAPGKGWPLLQGSPSGPAPLMESYAPAVVSDGFSIYVIGGTRDGTSSGTSQSMRVASVVNPTVEPQLELKKSDNPGAIKPGLHAYLANIDCGSDGINEIARHPSYFKTGEPAAISLKLTSTQCSTYTAKIYRADLRDIGVDPEIYGLVAQATSTGNAILTLEDTTPDPDLHDKPGRAGMLTALREFGQLNAPAYGLQTDVLPGTQQIFISGGISDAAATPSATIGLMTSGTAYKAFTVTGSAVGQAFHGHHVTAGAGNAFNFQGVAGLVAGANKHVTQSFIFDPVAMTATAQFSLITGLPNQGAGPTYFPEAGAAFFWSPDQSRFFLLGGVDGDLSKTASIRGQIYGVTQSNLSASTAGQLPRRLSLAGQLQDADQFYLVGGVVCRDDAGDCERTLSSQIYRAVVQ